MYRIECSNKLRKKNAACLFLLSNYITMHGPENVKPTFHGSNSLKRPRHRWKDNTEIDLNH